MRHARILLVMLVLGIGLLGAYFGVRGQDARPPWPPAPVMPPDDSEQSEPPPGKSKIPPPKPVTPQLLPTSPKKTLPKETAPARVQAAPVGLPPPAPTPTVNVEAPILANPATKSDATPPVAPLPAVTEIKQNAVDPPLIITAPETTPKENPLSFPPAPALEPTPKVDANQTRAGAPLVSNPAPSTITIPAEPPGAVSISKKIGSFQLVKPIRAPLNNTALPLEPNPSAEKPLIAPNPPGNLVAQSQGPMAFPAGNATPQVAIEKRGPAQLRSNEPLQFSIIVRNVGSTPASQVRVEDEIPAGTRITFADPQPVLQNDRAVWVIPSLAPGAEKQLKIELQAQGGGEFAGQTSVFVSTSMGLKTKVAQEIISLVVNTPVQVPVGFPVVLEVKVTNHGKQALTGLVLHGRLPSGVTHPAGKEIEADVGDLGAGATKTYKMPISAAQPGKHTVDVKITTQGGIEATGQGSVQVTQAAGAGLSINQVPTAKLYLEKESELRIEVTNNQPTSIKNLAVLDSLPDGVEFISASDRGLYRPDTRTAHWLIDHMGPGEVRTLALRVQAKAPGRFKNDVIARTESRQEIQSSAAVQVQGMSELVLTVSDREKTIEVGKPAIYEILVTNRGSAAATGVQLQATLPEGMAPSQMKGPTAFRVDGQQVVFSALPKLQPQGQALYYVIAMAQAPGDRRFRAQIVSDQDTTPIVREERTVVYRDN